MSLKKLLCISPSAAAVAGALGAPDDSGGMLTEWDIHSVASLREASRALRVSNYPVGLMLDLPGAEGCEATERFFREHRTTKSRLHF